MRRRVTVTVVVAAVIGTTIGVAGATLSPRVAGTAAGALGVIRPAPDPAGAAAAPTSEPAAPAQPPTAAPAAPEARPEVDPAAESEDDPRGEQDGVQAVLHEASQGQPPDQPPDRPPDQAQDQPQAEESEPPDEPDDATTDVAAVQQRLTELGYYVAGVDGVAGPATTSAVMAFQKVNSLVVDGVIGPATLAALEEPVIPQVRQGPPDRIEVDLDLQVLYWVEDDEIARILPVSSGSGATYTTADGGTARSLTPVGTYTIQRTIDGVREAPLGTLYHPMYFYRGWALHGSGSVPAYPASHGCVRLTRADARWLFERAGVGTTVILYGGTHTFTPASAAAQSASPGG